MQGINATIWDNMKNLFDTITSSLRTPAHPAYSPWDFSLVPILPTLPEISGTTWRIPLTQLRHLLELLHILCIHSEISRLSPSSPDNVPTSLWYPTSREISETTWRIPLTQLRHLLELLHILCIHREISHLSPRCPGIVPESLSLVPLAPLAEIH